MKAIFFIVIMEKAKVVHKVLIIISAKNLLKSNLGLLM